MDVYFRRQGPQRPNQNPNAVRVMIDADDGASDQEADQPADRQNKKRKASHLGKVYTMIGQKPDKFSVDLDE